MPQLTIQLSEGEYAQLQAFTAALKREASPQAQAACTLDSLAGALLLDGLNQRRREWYAQQAAGIAAACIEDGLDLEALSAMEAARAVV